MVPLIPRPRLLLAVLPLATFLGCGDNQDDAGARRLLAEVREQEYRSWERAPGWEQRKPSSAPHGSQVDIYIDDTLHEALVTGEPLTEWPVGSLVVKDGWDGSDLELIAILQKREDGWYYAEYDDDGDPDYSGRPDVCVGCHGADSDAIRAFALPR